MVYERLLIETVYACVSVRVFLGHLRTAERPLVRPKARFFRREGAYGGTSAGADGECKVGGFSGVHGEAR